MNKVSDNEDPKQVVAQGYNHVALSYAQLEDEIEWPRMRWLTKLLSHLQPGSHVLDLGCGSGDPADIAIAKEHQVTGVDISQTQINQARKNIPSGHFIHADAGSVRFPKASFAAVVSFYTLEHLPREEHKRLLKDIYDWLQVGGYFLISTEAEKVEGVVSEWLGVPMFFSSYGPETIKQFIQDAGFDLLEAIIEEQTEGNTVIPYLWIFAQKPMDG